MDQPRQRILIGVLFFCFIIFAWYIEKDPSSHTEVRQAPGMQCAQHSDCDTPMTYLIQSNCPFASACIDEICRVVCPLVTHTYPIEESRSEALTCRRDTDCDCSNRAGRSLECRCIDGTCFSIEE